MILVDFWPELVHISIKNGQFYCVMSKFSLIIVDFLTKIGMFFIRSIQFFSFAFKFCLVFIDFLAGIGRIFGILIRNGQFYSLSSKFVWYRSIFWLKQDDFRTKNPFFSFISKFYVLLVRIFTYFFNRNIQFLIIMSKFDHDLFDFLTGIGVFY